MGAGQRGSGRLHTQIHSWYLVVRCIAIRLRGSTEASRTIGQVSDCLLGEEALDDQRLIATVLRVQGAVKHTGLHGLTHTVLVQQPQ